MFSLPRLGIQGLESKMTNITVTENNDVIATSSITIAKSERIGNDMDYHRVIATLSDGRRAEFLHANFGHREYPHVCTRVYVFETDHIDGGVVVHHAGDVELLDRDNKMAIGRGGKIIRA